MGCSRRVVAARDLARGFEAGNGNETPLLSLGSTAITSKNKSAKDFRARDMMSSVFASVY
jgi:hypothetical protein